MPTSGAYQFKPAAKAVDGSIPSDDVGQVEPGEWAWIDHGLTGWHPMFRCPDCGQMGDLFAHRIDVQGNISPSVAHSYREAGVEKCGFHTQPTRLLGFTERRTP